MIVTGIGSLSGKNPREAAKFVAGTYEELPYVPELPTAGVGRDFIGRGCAFLYDLHFDLQPAGWRMVDRAGRDEIRARSALREDLDSAEEAFAGWNGKLKIQVPGAWTLCSLVERTFGGLMLSDQGACRDLSESLVVGVSEYVGELLRRIPNLTQVVIQWDEPMLSSVISGALVSPSGLNRIRVPEKEEILTFLNSASSIPGVETVLHSCARDLPISLLASSSMNRIALDIDLIKVEDIGQLVDADKKIGFGTEITDHKALVSRILEVKKESGLDVESAWLTPTCGSPKSSFEEVSKRVRYFKNVVDSVKEIVA